MSENWSGREVKNKDEAWALISFLQTDEWWDINMPITGQQPTRVSLQAKYPVVLRRKTAGRRKN